MDANKEKGLITGLIIGLVMAGAIIWIRDRKHYVSCSLNETQGAPFIAVKYYNQRFKAMANYSAIIFDDWETWTALTFTQGHISGVQADKILKFYRAAWSKYVPAGGITGGGTPE